VYADSFILKVATKNCFNEDLDFFQQF